MSINNFRSDYLRNCKINEIFQNFAPLFLLEKSEANSKVIDRFTPRNESMTFEVGYLQQQGYQILEHGFYVVTFS